MLELDSFWFKIIFLKVSQNTKENNSNQSLNFLETCKI